MIKSVKERSYKLIYSPPFRLIKLVREFIFYFRFLIFPIPSTMQMFPKDIVYVQL